MNKVSVGDAETPDGLVAIAAPLDGPVAEPSFLIGSRRIALAVQGLRAPTFEHEWTHAARQFRLECCPGRWIVIEF